MKPPALSLSPPVLVQLGKTSIGLLPDISVMPGQQWLTIENTPVGRGLAACLDHVDTVTVNQWILCPHDRATDQRLVELIDMCAKLRLAAPRLVQLDLALKAQ